MNTRKNITSGGPWEDKVGYSRAVKIGNTIEISGTTAPGNDAYAQTKAVIEMAKSILEDAGSSLEAVVRTRIYTTDIAYWEAIGKAHAEFFDTIRPAATMVEVAKLIAPEMKVEIEFTAVMP